MQIAAIVVGVVAFIGVVLWIGHVMEQRRTKAVKEAAAAMGYGFEEEGSQLLEQFVAFHLFQQGHSKRIRNVISGRYDDLDFRLFDYRYTVGSGKNSSTYAQTVAYVKSTRLALPTFALRPENIFHKIGGVFGYQDIDFDSHPTFSKKYLLRGQSEQEIRRTFAPHVLDFFQDNLNMSVEGFGDELVFYRVSTTIEPAQLRRHLDDTVRIHNVLAS